MLYTPLPIEAIMGLQKKTKCEIINIGNNGFVEAEKTADGTLVSRLISTDLKMYLNPKYAPGMQIESGQSGGGTDGNVEPSAPEHYCSLY